MVEHSTPLAVQRSAGLFGNIETGRVLTKKMIKNPAEIILHAGAYMNYWAGLYNAELKGMLEDGVKVMLSYAYRALSRQGQTRPLLQLAAPPDVHDDSDNDEE